METAIRFLLKLSSPEAEQTGSSLCVRHSRPVTTPVILSLSSLSLSFLDYDGGDMHEIGQGRPAEAAQVEGKNSLQPAGSTPANATRYATLLSWLKRGSAGLCSASYSPRPSRSISAHIMQWLKSNLCQYWFNSGNTFSILNLHFGVTSLMRGNNKPLLK